MGIYQHTHSFTPMSDKSPASVGTVSPLQSPTRLKPPPAPPRPWLRAGWKITWRDNLICCKDARPSFYERFFYNWAFHNWASRNQVCHKQVSHDRVSTTEPFLKKPPTAKSLQPSSLQLSHLKAMFLRPLLAGMEAEQKMTMYGGSEGGRDWRKVKDWWEKASRCTRVAQKWLTFFVLPPEKCQSLLGDRSTSTFVVAFAIAIAFWHYFLKHSLDGSFTQWAPFSYGVLDRKSSEGDRGPFAQQAMRIWAFPTLPF